MTTQILPRFYRHQQAEADAIALTKRLLETGEQAPEPTSRVLSLIGDERQLRGLPAIGRGVAGAINGTRPGAKLWI